MTESTEELTLDRLKEGVANLEQAYTEDRKKYSGSRINWQNTLRQTTHAYRLARPYPAVSRPRKDRRRNPFG